MFKVLLVMISLFWSNAIYAQSQESIILSNKEDIKEVEETVAISGVFSDKLAQCVQTGVTDKNCLCEHKESAKMYATATINLLKKHPNWSGKTLYYPDDNGNEIAAIFSDMTKHDENIEMFCKN